ncbi:hypothetical protein DL764_005537 [Monosporascus ibericus]|uniref:Rab proteins geranylgeranyltransferase n=1 Tax=Monosporascus ibericus TaxID=155417 RepID=A0A4Q4T8L8_9PEZI|nr:hypothetical protein DL764_005537 [Monosporascus ibericus]
MESLADEPWDAVICGTGLQQSLLALALSRSKKRILHIDPNGYYGEHEAAFSLQEVEGWAAAHAGNGETGSEEGSAGSSLFRRASIWKHEEADALGLSFSRAYSLALAPQIIHSRAKLLEQLVSSRAFRQIEFLAVGSFFIYDDAAAEDTASRLTRIPSTREDIFSTQSIPARSKRSLMKFLKFVVDYNSEENTSVWEGQARQPLADFLTSEFKLDETLRKYILALTLALDGTIGVEDGLATIHRHLTSMGLFGPGFCAVYPKWGGLSEVAQVACRAGAVGGGIYMLGTSMHIEDDGSDGLVSLKLSNEVTIRASTVISSQEQPSPDGQAINRLVAVVNSRLENLFEVVVEGSPIPAVAVVAFPPGCASTSINPVYAYVHSSDTGECPTGQSVIYLATSATSDAPQILERALESLLRAAAPPGETPVTLYKVQYVQSLSRREATSTARGGATLFSFPSPSLNLLFDDGCLDAVKAAWKVVTKDEVPEDEYMVFEDREGVDGDSDGVYD